MTEEDEARVWADALSRCSGCNEVVRRVGGSIAVCDEAGRPNVEAWYCYECAPALRVVMGSVKQLIVEMKSDDRESTSGGEHEVRPAQRGLRR